MKSALWCALAAISLLLLALAPQKSLAATCSGSVSGSVVSHGGCEIGGHLNDSADQLNTDEIFGLSSGWTQVGKVEADEEVLGGTDDFLTISGGGALSGNWSIGDAAWDTFDTVALVLKDGAGDPSSYVAYLILRGVGGGDATGTYTSPFVVPGTETLKNISHISLYGNVSAVPLPAALPLFGVALVGFAGFARRRKKLLPAGGRFSQTMTTA